MSTTLNFGSSVYSTNGGTRVGVHITSQLFKPEETLCTSRQTHRLQRQLIRLEHCISGLCAVAAELGPLILWCYALFSRSWIQTVLASHFKAECDTHGYAYSSLGSLTQKLSLYLRNLSQTILVALTSDAAAAFVQEVGP